MGALSSSDTNADRVGFKVSHETSGTPAAGLGAGISFEIEDAGDVEEQGRVSTVMETVTNGSEDSKIVFMVQAGGTLTNKAEVKKNSFNIPTSSSYAINGTNVLSGNALGSAVVSSALTSVGTLSALTVNGDVTVSAGSNDFDIASHDGTNGLKLDGTLVTSTAVELNYLDINTLGTSEASKAVTADSDGVVTLSSTLVVKGDSTTVGGNSAFELQRPTHGSGHGTALSIIGQKAGGTDGNGGDIELRGGEGSANGNGAGGDVILRTGAKTGSGSDGNIKIQKSDGADLLTITNAGVMTLADGTHDFNVASHDGTNGLQLGGVLVEATAANINTIKTGSKLATISGLTCSDGQVLEWLGSTWVCGVDNTRRRRLGDRHPEGINDYSSTSDSGTFFSDRRLKFGIQTIQNATDKLQRLRGVLYEFKSQEDVKHVKALPRGVQIGVIAQEVDEVLPQIVKTNKDGIKLVDYAALSGFLVQVSKEQQAALTQQKQVNKEQESQLKGQQAALTQQKQVNKEQESQLNRIAQMLHEERNDRHYDRTIFACVLLAICLAMWLQKRQIDSLQSSKVCTGNKIYTRITTKPV